MQHNRTVGVTIFMLSVPPPITTLKRIFQLIIWPHLLNHQKILPLLGAITMGHMKAIHKNVQSTQQKWPHHLPVILEAGIPPTTQFVPPIPEHIVTDIMLVKGAIKANSDIFCFTALANKQHGIIHTDPTGWFLCHPSMVWLTSLSCSAMMLVSFRWNQSQSDWSPNDKRFQKQCESLQKKSFHQQLNIMDNDALYSRKEFIQNEKLNLQLVPLHQHCAHMTECTIQVFKNHSIAAWSTTNPAFSIQLWEKLIPQAQDTHTCFKQH